MKIKIEVYDHKLKLSYAKYINKAEIYTEKLTEFSKKPNITEFVIRGIEVKDFLNLENEIHTRYTLQRITKYNDLYGQIHGSNYFHETACGKKTDENWYIVTNDWSGTITCKKCLKVLMK